MIGDETAVAARLRELLALGLDELLLDEPQRPAELSEEAWQATPLEVRRFLALLTEKIAALEARFNQTSQNSSKPPSSDPPSAPPAQPRTPRGKPKPKGAQVGHPDQQRDLLPEAEVDQLVPVHPTCCPHCHAMLPATLRPVCLPTRQQVWKLPEVRPTVIEYQCLTVCCPGCGSLATRTRPLDVPPGAFCPRVVALIALLHGRYRISDRELVALLQMVWQLPISLGSVAHLQQVASAALAPAHAEVQQAVERPTRSTPTRPAGAREPARPGCGWPSRPSRPSFCSSTDAARSNCTPCWGPPLAVWSPRID